MCLIAAPFLSFLSHPAILLHFAFFSSLHSYRRFRPLRPRGCSEESVVVRNPIFEICLSWDDAMPAPKPTPVISTSIPPSLCPSSGKCSGVRSAPCIAYLSSLTSATAPAVCNLMLMISRSSDCHLVLGIPCLPNPPIGTLRALRLDTVPGLVINCP